MKKKQVLVRFESRNFAVPDLFVTSRLNVPKTPKSLNSL